MSEIDDLKKENERLKKELTLSNFEVKLARSLADHRAELINKMLQKEISAYKNTSGISEQEAKIIKQMVERIDLDNKKYQELEKYLIKEFPKLLKMPNNKNKQTHMIDESKLSASTVDENGNVYSPQHIIDVTMILMTKLKEELINILGTNFSDNSETGEDDII